MLYILFMNTLLAIVISGLWCKIDIHVNLRCSNVILHVLRIKSYQQYCDYFFIYVSISVLYTVYSKHGCRNCLSKGYVLMQMSSGCHCKITVNNTRHEIKYLTEKKIQGDYKC